MAEEGVLTTNLVTYDNPYSGDSYTVLDFYEPVSVSVDTPTRFFQMEILPSASPISLRELAAFLKRRAKPGELVTIDRDAVVIAIGAEVPNPRPRWWRRT